jgi:hypothetical protein
MRLTHQYRLRLTKAQFASDRFVEGEVGVAIVNRHLAQPRKLQQASRRT